MCVCVEPKIEARMMISTFNGNTSTTIISCYSPINACDETDFITFNKRLSSLVRSIPKHNALIIGGDRNAQIGKNKNNQLGFTTRQTEMGNIKQISHLKMD